MLATIVVLIIVGIHVNELISRRMFCFSKYSDNPVQNVTSSFTLCFYKVQLCSTQYVVLLGSVQHPNINYFLSTCDACSREVFEFEPRATYIDISTSLHVKMHLTLDEPQHYYLQACTENL